MPTRSRQVIRALVAVLTDEQIDDLSFSGKSPVRLLLARRPRLTYYAKDTLMRDKDHEVRAVLAKRSDLLVQQVRTLAHDGHPLVRAAVASRRDLPTDIEATLDGDPDTLVQKALEAARRKRRDAQVQPTIQTKVNSK